MVWLRLCGEDLNSWRVSNFYSLPYLLHLSITGRKGKNVFWVDKRFFDYHVPILNALQVRRIAYTKGFYETMSPFKFHVPTFHSNRCMAFLILSKLPKFECFDIYIISCLSLILNRLFFLIIADFRSANISLWYWRLKLKWVTSWGFMRMTCGFSLWRQPGRSVGHSVCWSSHWFLVFGISIVPSLPSTFSSLPDTLAFCD